ncbi:MAG: alcohol dehydrogenase catalytic domain-containing protein [Phycisphaera sp.]|nr:alcohol dehydrogenase catalytic domain-containing protein [Phycisphaera sp.]
MRCLIYNGTEPRVVTDRDEPDAAPGEAIIRPLLAGVCSTDLEICKGYMGYTGVLGHEFVGVVEAVCNNDDRDDSAGAAWLGRRVVGEINCVCGRCDMCTRGLGNHCRERTVLGIVNRDGCFAERFALPVANLHVVPDHVPDEHAVFTEPLAAACQITKQIDVHHGDTVTVLGDGRLGQLCAQVLALFSDHVTLVGKHAGKLAVAAARGIDTRLVADVRPAADRDLVVDCTASPSGLDMALRLVRPRGTIVLKTTVADAAPLNLAPIVIHEINLVGSRCGPFDVALDLLADRCVDVDPLITDRLPLADATTALRRAASPDHIKVLLTFD